MVLLVPALIYILSANALIAFGCAFYWQAKVILTVFGMSNWDSAHAPWKALSDPKSPQNNFGRFIAGEIFPELRRKWLKAIGYVAASVAALFLVAGLLQGIAPEYLP